MVSSGNSLDYTAQDTAFFREQQVAVKEMEAAAIAWVAGLFHTPMFCLKAITDIVDGQFRLPCLQSMILIYIDGHSIHRLVPVCLA